MTKMQRELSTSEKPVVTNWNVYGLDESICGSKYPMSVDTDKCTSEMTDTVKKLAGCAAGSGHDQFLDGITVIFDLTFSNKAWVEAERYTFLNFVSSQSTMHRIAKFDIASQCNEYVCDDVIKICQKLADEYNADPTSENYLRLLYNIPSGFRLTAKMVTNYRALKTIYAQRKNHRLPEWLAFCEWVRQLPYAEELITGGK